MGDEWTVGAPRYPLSGRLSVSQGQSDVVAKRKIPEPARNATPFFIRLTSLLIAGTRTL